MGISSGVSFGRVPEHHPLVARTGDVEVIVLGLDPFIALLERLVHPLGDVGRLLVDRVDDGAGVRREAELSVGVADAPDRLAGDVLDVDVDLGRDLAGNHDEAGVDQRLARDAPIWVVGQDCVQNAIGDLIGDFVRVPLRDRLGGEKELVVLQIFAH